MNNNRHTPVRRGNIYCSPACGGGAATCTVERYEFAKAAGEALAKDLGPGWTLHMTHNLGWFASVGSSCRRVWVNVYDDGRGPPCGGRGSYSAFLGPPRDSSGGGKWHADGKTARAAIRKVLEAAMYDLGLVQGIVSGLTVPPKRRLKARR